MGQASLAAVVAESAERSHPTSHTVFYFHLSLPPSQSACGDLIHGDQ